MRQQELISNRITWFPIIFQVSSAFDNIFAFSITFPYVCVVGGFIFELLGVWQQLTIFQKINS